jgi:hypothetical protein
VLCLEELLERWITSVVDPIDLSIDGHALEDQEERAEELAG